MITNIISNTNSYYKNNIDNSNKNNVNFGKINPKFFKRIMPHDSFCYSSFFSENCNIGKNKNNSYLKMTTDEILNKMYEYPCFDEEGIDNAINAAESLNCNSDAFKKMLDSMIENSRKKNNNKNEGNQIGDILWNLGDFCKHPNKEALFETVGKLSEKSPNSHIVEFLDNLSDVENKPYMDNIANLSETILKTSKNYDIRDKEYLNTVNTIFKKSFE